MSRNSSHLFALGLIPQADYNTPQAGTTAPKNYEQVVKDNYGLAEYAPNVVTNQGYSTGSPFPTKSKTVSHDVTQSFVERLTSQLFGRRLLAVFGGYNVQTIAAGVYLHTFTPLKPNTELSLPVYPYVEKIGEPASDVDIIHDLLYPSFMAESLALSSPTSVENGAFLMGTTNWRGSGKQLGSAVAAQTGSGINFGIEGGKTPSHVVLDEEKSENFFTTTGALLNLYPQASLGGSAVPVGCDFRGLDFNYNNNLKAAQGYEGCGKFQVQTDRESGSVRGNLPIGNQTAELSVMALVSKALAQNPNPMMMLRKQSIFSLKLEWLGGLIANVAGTDYFHTARLKANKLTAKSVTVDEVDDLDRYNITAETLAPGASQPFSFEIQNNIPSYLTL